MLQGRFYYSRHTEADFRKAASYPNVYCKLSGMVTVP